MKTQQNIRPQSTSSRKMQSNRENAKKSTGPRTGAGKAGGPWERDQTRAAHERA